MTGDRRGVGIRLFVQGEEVVKRAFDSVSNSGRKMWAEIAMGSKSANPAVVALSRTSQEAQGAVGGLAARTGGAARVLSSFGATGIGVAAALGGLVLAFNQAREGMDWADMLADQADKLGISTETLQEYQYALRVTGGDAEEAGKSIEDFSKKFGSALGQYGKRDMKPFKALGFTQADLEGFDSLDDALQATIDKIAELENASEQAAIADKLGLSAMLPLIREGSGGFQRLADEARNLGVVMDEQLVRNAAEAKDQFDTVSQVIDIQLKQAFVDLGPVLVDIMGLVADLATVLADMADAWRDLDDQSTRGLRNQLEDLRGQRVTLRANQDLFGKDRGTNYGSGGEKIGRQMAATFGDTGAWAPKPIPDALAEVDRQIAAIEAELAGRAAARPTPKATGNRLAPQVTSGGGSAKERKGPTPEELAAAAQMNDHERRLAFARAAGIKVAQQAIEDEKYLADQRDKWMKQGYSREDAQWAANRDLEALRFNRDAGEFRKSVNDEGEGFETTDKVLEDASKAVDSAILWDADRRAEWARSVGDATADGLDAAINGDFFEWFKQQLYRAALQGLSDGVTQALSGAGGDGLYAFSNWLFGGGERAGAGGPATSSGMMQQADGKTSLGGWMRPAADFLGGLFGGGGFGFGGGRAAGGPTQAGAYYHIAEHGRPELAMIGNGYVADAETTGRMIRDAAGWADGMGGGANGVRAGGPREVTIRSVLEIPPGYVPDAQMARMLRATHDQAVASMMQQLGPASRADAVHYKFLKD